MPTRHCQSSIGSLGVDRAADRRGTRSISRRYSSPSAAAAQQGFRASAAGVLARRRRRWRRCSSSTPSSSGKLRASTRSFSAARASSACGPDADFRFLERLEAGAGRNQVAQDHVLLQADQVVDLAGQGRFGEHLGRFLEAGGRDEAASFAPRPW